eukprot:1194992-Prorocentrum_minimum.AAC.6
MTSCCVTASSAENEVRLTTPPVSAPSLPGRRAAAMTVVSSLSNTPAHSSTESLVAFRLSAVRPLCRRAPSLGSCTRVWYPPDERAGFNRPTSSTTSPPAASLFCAVTSSDPSRKSTSNPCTKCPAGAASARCVTSPVLQLNPTTSVFGMPPALLCASS